MKPIAAPLRLSTADPGFEADFKSRLHWSAVTDAEVEQRVAQRWSIIRPFSRRLRCVLVTRKLILLGS